MQNQRKTKKRKPATFEKCYQIMLEAYKSGKLRNIDLNDFKIDKLPEMPELKINLFEGMNNHEKKEL